MEIVKDNHKRKCFGLLPEDSEEMLGCYWRNHPCSGRTQELIAKLQTLAERNDIGMYGITGASGAGKDTFIEQTERRDVRFGDIMKDIAYKTRMVSFDKKQDAEDRSLRKEKLWNGKTAVSAWIALDIIRQYNPFAFIELSLEEVIHEIETEWDDYPIIFSGMRTEAGLDCVSELVGHENMIRVVKPGQDIVEEASLDKLITVYPTGKLVSNDGTKESLWRNAEKILK